jgi:hypothetical protein
MCIEFPAAKLTGINLTTANLILFLRKDVAEKQMLSRVCSPGFRGNNLELIMRALVKLFVFLGLVLLIAGFVAWKVPAAWILNQVNWSGQNIQYSRVTGTLWQGGVEQVLRNDVMLGDVKWDFMTFNDLTPLSTTWRLDGKGLDYEMSAYVDFEGTQATELRYVQGSIPASWVDLSGAASLVFLTGRFHMDLDRAALTGYTGRLATGTVNWNDAGLSGLVEEPLGSVLLQLSSEKGFTIANIQSEEGSDIMISGDVRFNAAQYRTNLLVRAVDEKQYVIEELAHLGTVLEDGSLELNLAGKMPR